MRTNRFRHLAGLAMLVACATVMCCTSDAAPAAAVPHRLAADRGQRKRVRAAEELTRRYARPPFAKWKVRAEAVGPLCNVLFVRTPVIMESSMVDAMHRGAGAYGIDGSGLQRFYLEQTFRGVAYRDGAGRVWTYGAVKESEMGELEPCR
jgi:hypothetical protein